MFFYVLERKNEKKEEGMEKFFVAAIALEVGFEERREPAPALTSTNCDLKAASAIESWHLLRL